jgi:hypothetical protein
MLVDPAINLMTTGPDLKTVYACESADPVEDSSFPVNGIQLSDFVYPSYFEAFHKTGADIAAKRARRASCGRESVRSSGPRLDPCKPLLEPQKRPFQPMIRSRGGDNRGEQGRRDSRHASGGSGSRGHLEDHDEHQVKHIQSVADFAQVQQHSGPRPPIACDPRVERPQD